MAHLKLTPAPIIGILLRQLLEAVLEDPALNRRDRLLTIAGNFYRSRLESSTAAAPPRTPPG
jgi:hypothetical protein